MGETEAPQPDTIPSASADGSETEESEETEEADPTRYAAARTDALEMAAHPYRVVDKLAFPFADENGACIGFNLDEIASDSKEDDDCGWEDQVSPDGVPGVDNNLAFLTPVFDSVGLGQAFLYLQDSIESSGFFFV